MSDFTPCRGRSALFDATDYASHRQAAALCATCPIIETCRELRNGAEGTWGGKLYRSKRTQTLANPKPRRSRAEREANGAAARERRAREEAAYSDEEARRAHAAYIAEPSPSEWARTGHRVYTRRQAQKARGVAA